MKIKLIIGLVAFVWGIFNYFIVNSISLDNNIDHENLYKVKRVVDGDTIVATKDGIDYTVRLIGVNTPESVDPRRPVECYGKEASSYVNELLNDKLVYLESDPTQTNVDRYGRLLRYVYLGDELINQKIINEGFGLEYTYNSPYQFQKEFRDAQLSARNQNKGLWNQNNCPNNSQNIITNVFESNMDTDQCNIKGNISNNQKIYHLPNCRDYQKTQISVENGEKWFCTEDEAIEAGWRKAKNC